MTVRSTCPYCGVGCGVAIEADGAVAGDREHPANFGRLCSKGAALGETTGPAQRLTRPMLGGVAVSWDEALDTVAARFEDVIRRRGPDAVAFYVSGQLLTEDYYVANKLMKGFIGSGNIDTNSRLCMSSSVSGHVRAFGGDVVPGNYQDFEEADLVVLVGSNLAWCHPVLYQRLVAARATRGTRIVVIDPRRTATCDVADLHLKLAAGSDVMLFQGLLSHLTATGRIASDWLRRNTSGFEATLAAARADAPDLGAVAAATGLATAEIEAFYMLFADTSRTVTAYSQGVNQSFSGTDKVNAIVNCHLATGRIGRAGMGPFSLTGQPNAMGGREVGGLSNQLAAHMGFDDPAHIDRVRRFWRAPRLTQRPGLKAVELFEAIEDGRIEAVLIMATNPAASLPRADRVRAALAACPFVVVADCWPTDTTETADLVLPAAGWGEKDGTVTNSERRISRQRAFQAPPGEARPDWWILSEIGRRLGFAGAFAYRSAADVFREHAALSGFENGGERGFDISGLATVNDAEYDAMAPIQWPVPSGRRTGTPRLFAEGGFLTPDRKARLVPLRARPAAAAAIDPTRSFTLNTGRIRDQWHTMTRTGRVPRLMAHLPAPMLTLNPADAAALGIVEGDLVRVETAHGARVLPAQPSADQRPGDVFVSMHWTRQFSASGPIDALVDGLCDPISGQPALKSTRAGLTRVPVVWRGLLARTGESPLPTGDLVVRTPVATGSLTDLAGSQALPAIGSAFDAWRDALTGLLPAGQRIDIADHRRLAYRMLGFDGDRLVTALFIVPAGAALPDRDLIAGQLGQNLTPVARLALLAGRSSAGAGRPEGPTVCACYSVGRDRLRHAIAADHLSTVDAIGVRLKAGTNCGSCIPELRRLLDEALVPAA